MKKLLLLSLFFVSVVSSQAVTQTVAVTNAGSNTSFEVASGTTYIDCYWLPSYGVSLLNVRLVFAGGTYYWGSGVYSSHLAFSSVSGWSPSVPYRIDAYFGASGGSTSPNAGSPTGGSIVGSVSFNGGYSPSGVNFTLGYSIANPSPTSTPLTIATNLNSYTITAAAGITTTGSMTLNGTTGTSISYPSNLRLASGSTVVPASGATVSWSGNIITIRRLSFSVTNNSVGIRKVGIFSSAHPGIALFPDGTGYAGGGTNSLMPGATGTFYFGVSSDDTSSYYAAILDVLGSPNYTRQTTADGYTWMSSITPLTGTSTATQTYSSGSDYTYGSSGYSGSSSTVSTPNTGPAGGADPSSTLTNNNPTNMASTTAATQGDIGKLQLSVKALPDAIGTSVGNALGSVLGTIATNTASSGGTSSAGVKSDLDSLLGIATDQQTKAAADKAARDGVSGAVSSQGDSDKAAHGGQGSSVASSALAHSSPWTGFGNSAASTASFSLTPPTWPTIHLFRGSAIVLNPFGVITIGSFTLDCGGFLYRIRAFIAFMLVVWFYWDLYQVIAAALKDLVIIGPHGNGLAVDVAKDTAVLGTNAAPLAIPIKIAFVVYGTAFLFSLPVIFTFLTDVPEISGDFFTLSLGTLTSVASAGSAILTGGSTFMSGALWCASQILPLATMFSVFSLTLFLRVKFDGLNFIARIAMKYAFIFG